ncbi:MAG: hypothetical protein K5681_05285, partial [Treponema sp.]|nr:hypothetical protein [Treponema sp.]
IPSPAGQGAMGQASLGQASVEVTPGVQASLGQSPVGVNPMAQSPVGQAPVSQPLTANPSPAENNDMDIPEGLPRLSMLNSLPDEEEEGGEAFQVQDSQETQNPFLNGGPLPPEQSVESEAQVEQEPIDERLIIHLPQAQVNSEGENIPTVVVPESDIGYTENPDDEWSNMDAPPDDEEYYPSDSERAKIVEQEYNSFTKNDEPAHQAPVQLDEKLTTADGRVISIAQLRGSVMAALSLTDSFASTNLESTGAWHVRDNRVETTVNDSYVLELLKRKQTVIAAEISKICGKPMECIVRLEENNSLQQKEEVKVPAQVEMLVNMFNGTIVAGKH